MSYFADRMASIGCEAPYEMELTDPNGRTYGFKLFREDKQGNIAIQYPMLSGGQYKYESDGRWDRPYFRTRLQKPIRDMKYRSPKGQGLLPYFTEPIITAYQKARKIPTLYLVEGEFKAFVAADHGIPAIGMGSIHGFYGAKNEHEDPHDKTLHADIAAVIEQCDVRRIVLLLDADTRKVSYRYGKDLYQRQHSFRVACANFYKVCSVIVNDPATSLEEVHLMHGKRHLCKNEQKGLDDLLLANKNKTGAIIDELRNLPDGVALKKGRTIKWFEHEKLESNYYSALERHFGLASASEFFKRYRDDIGGKQFLFRNAFYIQDGEGDEVRFVYHRDTELIFRIGTDWMKKVEVPDKHGLLQEEVVPWSKGAISEDYPKNRFPGFEDKLKRYDAFCNVPSFNGAYRREHNGCYNLCNPFMHQAETGSIENTLRFLKHVFGGEGLVQNLGTPENPRWIECASLGDQFTVALDWLTIFHRRPTQMLPVPILVSKEYRTGKTTFLKWLRGMYGTNMAILNNEQFKMRFNGHYITKMLIAIDEGFLDVDKKAEKERLKQMVTGDSAYLEHKGVNLKAFPYYGKLILCSNDADSVMKMENDENRWFVVKVSTIPENMLDPDMEQKLLQEIPAWVDFLNKRPIYHPRESRLWFRDDYFITEQFLRIVENTKTRVEKNIDELFRDLFMKYELSELRLDRAAICDMLNEISKYKIDQQEVKRYLDDKLGYKLERPRWIEIPRGLSEEKDGNGQHRIITQKKKARHYLLRPEDWLSKEELDDTFRAGAADSTAKEGVGILTKDKIPF